ncbi:MAG: NAD(P)-binding domain-containing protein [Edaphobacter sp.]|uniref:NADPH-dependent F420 reductase n=1 Tax=Edaphobacter sp. TaxID=1934404 RepID=UPI0023965079|nr:NAD(P)-binding domain-containing protein [Edaphobacter sp.]MDE1177117.1 NAD(P)-binding domain-containing protein [Edaphobacter sp.]
MKIGIIGAGGVGSALAVHFRKLQHAVQIANSRGPETLSKVAEETGTTAVAISDVAKGVDLLVIAIPEKSVPLLPKDLLGALPSGAPIVDTGNYYPQRDGLIAQIEGGMTESEWVSSVLGRPVIKAFNNIFTYSIINGGLPKGSQTRIALPISGEDMKAKQLLIALLDGMGFDGIDAGPLSESWRQQPGTPAYCTDYNAEVLRGALASANIAIASQMRDAGFQTVMSLPPDTPPEEIVRFARAQWTTFA